MVATNFEYRRNKPRSRSNIPQRRSKHDSCTVETYFEHGQNILRARSKHTSSDRRTKFCARSKYTSSTVEIYLERQSKHTSCMVETNIKSVKTYLELGRNIPRARSKHTSGTVETYIELCRKHNTSKSKQTSRDGRNIPRATAERYLKHGRNIPRARSKQTSSTVETYHQHDRSIHRA